MKKIDFKSISMRVVGVAVGVVAGAQANANLAKIEMFNESKGEGNAKKRAIAMIALGTLAPEFLPLPKKNMLIENAFDGILAKGVEVALQQFLPAEQVDKVLPVVAGIGNYEQFIAQNPYMGENIYLGEGLKEGEMVQDPETGAFYELKDGELVPAEVSMNGANSYEDSLV